MRKRIKKERVSIRLHSKLEVHKASWGRETAQFAISHIEHDDEQTEQVENILVVDVSLLSCFRFAGTEQIERHEQIGPWKMEGISRKMMMMVNMMNRM